MPFDGRLSDGATDFAEGFHVSFFNGYKYGVSCFPGTRQRYPSRNWEGDWAMFVGELAQYSRKCFGNASYAPLYSPTSFIRNTRRRVNTTTSGIIPLDLDQNSLTFDEVCAVLRRLGLAGIVHTTKRNTTLGPGSRMRVIIPLSTEVDIWGYRSNLREITDALRQLLPNLTLDQTKVEPESEFFVPGRYRGAVNRFKVIGGQPWCVAEDWKIDVRRCVMNEEKSQLNTKTQNAEMLRLLGRLPKKTYQAGAVKMPWMLLEEAGRAPFLSINDRNYVHSLTVIIDDPQRVDSVLDRLRETGVPLPNIRTRNYLTWVLEKAVGLHTKSQQDRFLGWLRAILAGLARVCQGTAGELFAPIANPLHGEIVHNTLCKLSDFKPVQPRGGREHDGLPQVGNNEHDSRIWYVFDRLRFCAYANARPGETTDYYKAVLIRYREAVWQAAIDKYGADHNGHALTLDEVDATINSVASWVAAHYTNFQEKNRGVMGLAGADLTDTEKRSRGGHYSTKVRRQNSRRHAIHEYLRSTPEATRSELKGIFGDVSIRTIDYVRQEFRREQVHRQQDALAARI